MTATIQVPSLIDDRFALESQSRRGGMGTVWRAHDRRSGKAVAVKVLHQAGAEEAERFVREAAFLADLSHPGIVSYVAHGRTVDGLPYLAMEWLEGENVAERLAREPLTLLESLTLLRAVLDALAVAHGRGIVHRDLKPSNLFLRADRVAQATILDLGIARYLNAARDLTRTGSILGTPGYMAPEQAQGLGNPTPAADVFSLGCVLFECLTGDPPFTGAHVFTVLAKVLFMDAPRLRDLRAEMPAAVDELLERMLAKDPARRLADAGAVLGALDAIAPVPEVGPPRIVSSPPAPRPTGAEQELVSVILATPTTDDDASEELPDVSPYGAELKRLADGTTVVSLAQRGGAATDLAARAARCALRLRDARPRWRLVLATGRGVHSERAYVGEAVDRAGSMLLRARAGDRGPDGNAGDDGGSDGARGEPASIWLDEVTAGLLGARFRTTRLGDGVFALEGEDPSLDPERRLLGRPTTCVGRDHELGMLDLFLRACTGESSARAVLVSGPPGIGKSRVRHEFLRQAQLQHPELAVLVGLGDPIRASGSCGLLGSAIARLCGVRADGSEEENRAALERRIGRCRPREQQRTTVFIGELCGLQYPVEALPQLRAARQNPKIMADLVTQSWLDFLRAEAAAAPVLLVLDDLQWSDALTVSLVGAALRELASSPLMVLALGRPETAELFPDLWSPRLVTLPLQPLGAAATSRLIRQVLGDRISDESVSRIGARAGGNALYLEELIRAAEDQRDAVPETVLAMLQARIGLLPAPVRRVLRAASVFGEAFPAAGVAALLRDREAADDLTSGLQALVRHEIIEAPADQAAGDGWRFRHALMRDAAYGLMTAEDCAASHAGAARFLEATDGDAAVIAAHYERAADLRHAVRYYTIAAEQAYRRSDLAGAVSLLGRGLACGAVREERGTLLGLDAYVRFFQHDFAASWTASTEALALLPRGHLRRAQSLSSHMYAAIHLGKSVDLAAIAEEMLAEDPGLQHRADYVDSLGYACISYAATGNRQQAARLVDRIASLDVGVGEADDDDDDDGDRGGDRDPLVSAHVCYWRTRLLQLLGDDPYAAWLYAQQGVRCYERSGDRRMHSFMLAEVGECARRLYSVADGAVTLRQAIALGSQLHEPVTTAFLQQYLATLLAEHGAAAELDEARALARSVLELAPGGAYHALGQISTALVCLRDGDLPEAERVARAAHATIHGIGLYGYVPHVDAALLQVLTRAGDRNGAAALADAALLAAESKGPMGLMDLPLRLHIARAHLAAGRRADAARGVAQALAALDRQAAKIADLTVRARFATDVPEHAALRALAGELGELLPARPPVP